MEQHTQQWPLKFYHETGALGVFLFLPFAFLLGFWWAQQFWAAVLMTLVGLALIVYRGRKKQADQPFTHLGYNSLQGWYLVRHVVGDTHADRKSTRLNSSHVAISYAVFCLKKKNNITDNTIDNTIWRLI